MPKPKQKTENLRGIGKVKSDIFTAEIFVKLLGIDYLGDTPCLGNESEHPEKYNLSFPLKDQSEETLQFLLGVLENKT